MRIVTRANFDGIVCAALLKVAIESVEDILWVEPEQIVNGNFKAQESDIIANLPFHENCCLWFDHHPTNRIGIPYNGIFEEAPSASGLIYRYFPQLSKKFDELVRETDKIDSGNLTWQEVTHPSSNPYFLVSMTILNNRPDEEKYWNHLVNLICESGIYDIINDVVVNAHCDETILNVEKCKKLLKKNTKVRGRDIAISDLRHTDEIILGNRYLAYTIYPESIVNIKLTAQSSEFEKTKISIGHNIFNKRCRIHIGNMLKNFGGGGHYGVGSVVIDNHECENVLKELVDLLSK